MPQDCLGPEAAQDKLRVYSLYNAPATLYMISRP